MEMSITKQVDFGGPDHLSPNGRGCGPADCISWRLFVLGEWGLRCLSSLTLVTLCLLLQRWPTTWAWDTGPFPTSCDWASGRGYCGDACPSPEVRLLGDGPWLVARLQAQWPEQRGQSGESSQQLSFQKSHSGESLFLRCSVCLNVGWFRPPIRSILQHPFGVTSLTSWNTRSLKRHFSVNRIEFCTKSRAVITWLLRPRARRAWRWPPAQARAPAFQVQWLEEGKHLTG